MKARLTRYIQLVLKHACKTAESFRVRVLVTLRLPLVQECRLVFLFSFVLKVFLRRTGECRKGIGNWSL